MAATVGMYVIIRLLHLVVDEGKPRPLGLRSLEGPVKYRIQP